MAIYGQPEHDIIVEINPYLVENYPMLTWQQRNAIGHLCVTDEELDLDPIYEHIDAWVAYYCEEKGIELPEVEEEEDSE
mgnify:CR=1 FL=1